MTTKEQVNNARKKYYEARMNYLKTVKEAVMKERGFYLVDETSDEDGKPVRIQASSLDNYYEYYPSFDKVNIQVQNLFKRERTIFIFHVVDGDDLFSDNTWVPECYFSEDRLCELLGYIEWNR